MEISFNSRMASPSESVVLHTYVSISDEPNPVVRFMAEVHEETPTDIFCGDCGYRVGSPKVFHCSGAGLQDWTKAHALFDLLFVPDYKAKIRVKMDSWIHESISRGLDSCQLRIEVRNEEFGSTNSRQRTSWTTLGQTYHGQDGPSLVVPQDGSPTLAKSYVDPC